MTWVRNTYGTTAIVEMLSHPPWSPGTISWGPATIHDPDTVTDSFGNPYDFGINDTNCLVLTFGANLRGVSPGGAAFPCGVSCINNDAAWQTLHGRITSNFYIRDTTYNGPGHAGIICLASSTNIDEGSGTRAYALVYDNILFSARFRLIQLNNGFSGSPGGAYGSSYTILAQSGWHLASASTVYTMALEWEVNQTYLYGARLHAFVSASPTLSEPYLVEWHVLYTSSDAWVPTGPVSGGSGAFCIGSTGSLKTYFDNTSIAP